MSLVVHDINPGIDFIPEERLIRDLDIPGGIDVQKEIITAGNGQNIRNTVIKSNSAVEETLDGEFIPAQMLISESGANIVRNNPGLLRRVQDGTVDGLKTMKGTEGLLKVVVLNTSSGPKQFVIKYTSAVNKQEDGITFYTPQVDAMRILQLADAEQPVVGMNYLAPVIATIDTSITPYIDNTVNLTDIGQLTNISAHSETLEPETKILLEKIHNHKHGKTVLQFMTDNAYAIVSPKSWPFKAIEGWVLDKYKSLKNKMISKQTARVEASLPRNTVVDLNKLAELVDSIPQEKPFYPRATDYDGRIETDSEFLKSIRSCCYVVELLAGYKLIRELRRNT